MDDRTRRIEQWYHLAIPVGTIFTLVGIHYLDLLPLFLGAVLAKLAADIAKYVAVSSYSWLYMTVGHSVVLWVWTLGTSVYFLADGDWVRGFYPVAYMFVLSTLAGLPSQLIVDGFVTKRTGRHPKYYGAARL
jgi:hypothetical protein